jgi:pimeloyl-ACP methyl ester carboxylesterase
MAAWRLTKRYAYSGGDVAWDVLGTGTPVLLVHGFPGNSFTWRSLAPALAREYRVYVVDLPGFGASAQYDGQNVGLAALSDFVTDFLLHLQLTRPAVIAHDAGAPVVLGAYLLRQVDLDRLVLLDAATLNPCISANSAHARQYLEAYQTMPQALHEVILRKQISSAMHHEMPDEVFWGYFRPWTGPGQAAYYRFLAQLDEGYLDDIPDPAANRACAAPALVMTAEFDPLRDEAEAYASRLAAENVLVELVRVPGVVHGFLDHADSVDLAREALADVCAYLRRALACAGPQAQASSARAMGSGNGGERLCGHDAR